MVDDIKSPDDPGDPKTDIYQNLKVHDRPKGIIDADRPQKPKKGDRFTQWLSSLSPRQRTMLLLAIIIGLALIGGAIWYFVFRTEPTPGVAPTVTKSEETAKPTTEASRLTGLQVPPEVNQRTVTGVMIENSPDARPQAGLKDAGVVYEAVVEGGITRFMAVFQDTQPDYVGPVRSVRPYFLDFLGPYNAAIMHVGGSGEALAQIKAQGIKDLDKPGAFNRDSSRYAPHNAFSSIPKLKEIEQQSGYTANPYEGFARGGDETPVSPPTARVVNIRMSSTLYNVNYEYDPATNTYKRSEGGKPHMDAKSNTQLSPKVLVVPVVPRSQSGIYSVYAINGSGKVYVFQNGTAIEGTWSKSDRKGQFKFTGADGQPLKLATGQTWVTLAASAADVTAGP